jgi:hypothetical protein
MPGTTNFTQFDPNLTNAENDAQYAADSMRAGGAALDAILPSPLFNKFAHQVSTFVAAFAQALANKGFSPSDANFANLVAILMNVNTSADVASLITTVPYATSVTFDASLAAKFDLTLTGNVSSSSLTDTVPGQLLAFIVNQDAIGSRTFAWPSTLTGTSAIATQANSTSIQMFVVRPNGAIVPATPMLWITSAGLIIAPLPLMVSVSTSGNISNANKEIIEQVNASAGTVTRNVFTAVGYSGYKVRLKKMDSSVNPVTIAAQTGQTIDGQASVSIIRQNDSLTLMSDNANWIIV